MRACSLVIDARERNVLRHMAELADTPHEVKQITTADYVLVGPGGAIMAVFERKSYEDFAASFKDGRSENVGKLKTMRDATGCRIFYIIEGIAFPNPKDYFGNIAYQNIESSIFHLQMRDGINVIKTKDTLHTAQTLARFVTSMNSLVRKEGEVITGGVQEKPVADLADEVVTQQQLIEQLTAKHKRTIHEQARDLWSCFPGITTETADEYSSKWSIADVCKGIPRADLAAACLSSGKKLPKRACESLTAVPKATEIKLLSRIEGVSQNAAKCVMAECTITQLLTYGKDGIAIKSAGKTKKIGPVVAQRIIDLLNYKYVRMQVQPGEAAPEQPVEVPVAVADAPVPAPAQLAVAAAQARAVERGPDLNFGEAVACKAKTPTKRVRKTTPKKA
jgi:ERCC4-type nuclease